MFSNFEKGTQSGYREGYHLDKDILKGKGLFSRNLLLRAERDKLHVY